MKTIYFSPASKDAMYRGNYYYNNHINMTRNQKSTCCSKRCLIIFFIILILILILSIAGISALKILKNKKNNNNEDFDDKTNDIDISGNKANNDKLNNENNNNGNENNENQNNYNQNDYNQNNKNQNNENQNDLNNQNNNNQNNDNQNNDNQNNNNQNNDNQNNDNQNNNNQNNENQNNDNQNNNNQNNNNQNNYNQNNNNQNNENQNNNEILEPVAENIYPLNNQKKSEVMTIYNRIGDNDKYTLSVFKNFLSENTRNLDEEQKVYLAYYWITSNIKYDYDAYYGTGPRITEPEKFFERRSTVCSGYALLFKELLSSMNMNDVIIVGGYSKGMGYLPIIPVEVNHDWNAVKINGKWCLVDTTWGSPSDTYYLCTPPKCFVRDHLPEESKTKYQLLDTPISVKTFGEYADVRPFCCKTNCKIIEDKAIQNKCSGKITFKYNHDSKVTLKVYKGYTDYSEIPQNYVKEIEGGYDILYQYDQTGLYSFSIYGYAESISGSISYFMVDCKELAKIPFNYPILEYYYPIYDAKLISPTMIDLTKGRTYNFEIEIEDSLDICVKIDDEMIALKKTGNTYKEEIYIHGDSVKIVSVICNEDRTYYNYYYIVSYNTIGSDVEYPKTYTNTYFPNLISPLKKKLYKGNTYEFKIKTSQSITILIYHCNTLSKLVKNGDIHSINYKIKLSCSDSVLYVYAEPPNKSLYYYLYEYAIE